MAMVCWLLLMLRAGFQSTKDNGFSFIMFVTAISTSITLGKAARTTMIDLSRPLSSMSELQLSILLLQPTFVSLFISFLYSSLFFVFFLSKLSTHILFFSLSLLQSRFLFVCFYVFLSNYLSSFGCSFSSPHVVDIKAAPSDFLCLFLFTTTVQFCVISKPNIYCIV